MYEISLYNTMNYIAILRRHHMYIDKVYQKRNLTQLRYEF